MYGCFYVGMNICLYAYKDICMRVDVVHTCTSVYTYSCIVDICISVYTYMPTCICIYVQCMCICLYTYVYVKCIQEYMSIYWCWSKQEDLPYAIATPLIHTLWDVPLIYRVWIARYCVDVYQYDLRHVLLHVYFFQLM